MSTATAPLPHLILHALTSLDGRVALSPDVLLMTDPRWPSYEDSGYSLVIARHHPQVILEGSGSFVIPDAGPCDLPATSLGAEQLRQHYLPPQVMDAPKQGWMAVVDTRGRVCWQYKAMPEEGPDSWHVMVLVSETTPLDYLAFLRDEQIPYLVVGAQRADLPRALAALAQHLGAATVVATCGGHLGGALLRAGVVDLIEVELLPLAVGGERTPALFTAPDLGPDDPPTPLHLQECTPLPGGRLLLSYAVASREQ